MEKVNGIIIRSEESFSSQCIYANISEKGFKLILIKSFERFVLKSIKRKHAQYLNRTSTAKSFKFDTDWGWRCQFLMCHRDDKVWKSYFFRWLSDGDRLIDGKEEEEDEENCCVGVSNGLSVKWL